MAGALFSTLVLPVGMAFLIYYWPPERTTIRFLIVAVLLPGLVASCFYMWLLAITERDAANSLKQSNETMWKNLDLIGKLINRLKELGAETQTYAQELEEARNDLAELQSKAPRGRPGKVISMPTAGGQAISKPITDPAVMAYLIQLQEAKERRELAQVCKENPWGGPAIYESTARGWLDRYRDEISAARNSGNYS